MLYYSNSKIKFMKKIIFFLSITLAFVAQAQKPRANNPQDINGRPALFMADLVLSDFKVIERPTPFTFRVSGKEVKQQLMKVEFVVKNAGNLNSGSFSVGFQSRCALTEERWFFASVTNQEGLIPTPEDKVKTAFGLVKVIQGLQPRDSVRIRCYVAVAGPNNTLGQFPPTNDLIRRGLSGICGGTVNNPSAKIHLRCIVDYPEVNDISIDKGIVKERNEIGNNRFVTTNILLSDFRF